MLRARLRAGRRLESRPLKPSKPSPPPSRQPALPGLPPWFCLFAGIVFGLIFVKQGNPVIFAKLIVAPVNVVELALQFWPISWGYQLLLALGLATVLMCSRTGLKPGFRFDSPWPIRCLLLGLAWLGWQCLAATQTINAHLTSVTLAQFIGCLVCFAFGLFILRHLQPVHAPWFWTPLLLALGYSLWAGWDQHFGGLQQIREQVLSGSLASTNALVGSVTDEALRKKAMSNRIYGTFVYPNTFAGGILLLLPLALAWLYTAGAAWAKGLRFALMAGVAAVAGACLAWSGSKSAWLIAVAIGVVAIWLRPWSVKLKVSITLGVTVLGLTAFGLRYAGYFQKGAQSVESRFDYWRAAWAVSKAEPVLGTGPGTFQIPYQRMKAPESEMARLAHNDYLEQASDSGWPGFVLFIAWIGATGWALVRSVSPHPIHQAALLGWLAIQIQGLSEFNLYIPGIAWIACLLAGWLLGRNPFDTPKAAT